MQANNEPDLGGTVPVLGSGGTATDVHESYYPGIGQGKFGTLQLKCGPRENRYDVDGYDIVATPHDSEAPIREYIDEALLYDPALIASSSYAGKQTYRINDAQGYLATIELQTSNRRRLGR
jgi:hypothetical protein